MNVCLAGPITFNRSLYGTWGLSSRIIWEECWCLFLRSNSPRGNPKLNFIIYHIIFNWCIFHFWLSLLFWYLIRGRGLAFACRCFKGDRLIEQTLQYRLQIDGHMKIHDQLFHLCILNQSRRELFWLLLSSQ